MHQVAKFGKILLAVGACAVGLLAGQAARADLTALVTYAAPNPAVRQFDLNGNYLGDFAPGNVVTGPINPYGITNGPDGNVYITDLLGATAGIYRVNIPSGGAPTQIVGAGAGTPPLASAYAIVTGPDSNLYVTDPFNNAVSVFTTAGVFVRSYTNPLIAFPFGLAVQGTDLLVASTGTDQVVRISNPLGVPTYSNFAAVNDPNGIGVDGSGNVFVSSGLGAASDVLKFTSAGALDPTFDLDTSNGLLQTPVGVTIGPNGNLFVVSQTNRLVLEYNATTGAFVRTFINFPAAGDPHFLVFTDTTVVPEPASLALVGLGGLVLAAGALRRRGLGLNRRP